MLQERTAQIQAEGQARVKTIPVLHRHDDNGYRFIRFQSLIAGFTTKLLTAPVVEAGYGDNDTERGDGGADARAGSVNDEAG